MKYRTRRKRRQARASLNFGRKARPTHKLKTGRTGSVHEKRMKSPGIKPLKMKTGIYKVKLIYKNGSLVGIQI